MRVQLLDLRFDAVSMAEQQVTLLSGRSVTTRMVGLVGAHVLDPDTHRA